MSRVTVLGDGGWGTALALLLHRHGHAVRLWSPFPDYAEQLRRTRENAKFLPGVPLPPDLLITADRAEAAADARTVVLATPSEFYTGVLASFAAFLPRTADVVSVTKGLDPSTHRRMSEVAESILGRGPIAVLSGPSFAEEVARGLPAAVVVAAGDAALAHRLQRLFGGETFRVYTSDDVIGVELGGALKNVIAIAAGACDGLGLGFGAKAALVTRGLAEITRLGVAGGAHAATLAGLSGVGDLTLTCFGRLSRNRQVGERIGRGESVGAILSGMAQVAEGVRTAGTACARAADAGIEMPIADAVRRLVRGDLDPRRALKMLMTRDPRPERDRHG